MDRNLLHSVRAVHYRQLFKICPDNGNLHHLEDTAHPLHKSLVSSRLSYEALKQSLPPPPPHSSRRQSLSSSCSSSSSSSSSSSLEEADPIFFKSPQNVSNAHSIVAAFSADQQSDSGNPHHPASPLMMDPSTVSCMVDLALVLMYSLNSDNDRSDPDHPNAFPVPSIVVSSNTPSVLEADAYQIFRAVHPLISLSSSSSSSLPLLHAALEAILTRTAPATLMFGTSHLLTLTTFSSFFIPASNLPYLLSLYDQIFPLWCPLAENTENGGGGGGGGNSLNASPSDLVYFNASDPLASPRELETRAPASSSSLTPPLPPVFSSLSSSLPSLSSSLPSPSSLPYLLPELLASVILASATSEFTSSLAPPPLSLSALYPEAATLIFSAKVLHDPKHGQCSNPSATSVTSHAGDHILSLASFLCVPPEFLSNGCSCVTFAAGPLGMLLRHVPSVGLTVNSFQGSGGQAESSLCILLGDVLVAVNGSRLTSAVTAHDLVSLISSLPRPVMVTFAHANIRDDFANEAEKVDRCVADGYKLSLAPGEALAAVAQAQMKASTYGVAAAAGGMAGVGVGVDECSALQHPVTTRGQQPSPVSSAWMAGVAMAQGALFVTNYRVVFHRAAGNRLTVDESVVEKNAKTRARSKSPMRQGTRATLERSAPTTSGDGSSIAGTSAAAAAAAAAASSAAAADVDRAPSSSASESLTSVGAALPPSPSGDFEIPVAAVLKVECFGEHEYGIIKVNVPTLGVIAKDGRAVKFVLPFQLGNTHDSCLAFGKSISENAFEVGGAPTVGATTWGGEWTGPERERQLPTSQWKWGSFPFLYKASRDKNAYNGSSGPGPIKGAGNSVFGDYFLMREYERMGLLSDSGLKVIQSSKDLHPCRPVSYPEELVVPASMTNDELRRVCSFRSKARIPVVVYKHKSTGATMSRSAQPLIGIAMNRSTDDEKLLARIMKLTDKSKFYIMDARKKTAATGNKIMGKGTEDTKNYQCSQMLHMDIANIHAVRDSENMLWDLCRPSSAVGSTSSWWGKLDNTQWLQHVHSCLAAGARCAAILSQEGASVLVHCSDGWDRTAQICSICEILLDPYCRTFKGFRAVIEKHWLCFGHKFDDRNGRGASKGSQLDEERSPIFGLFVDCVWTAMQQFPRSFEFNENLLLALLDQLTSGKCGTFLGNCKNERETCNYKDGCVSVWDYLIAEYGKEEFENKEWKKREKREKRGEEVNVGEKGEQGEEGEEQQEKELIVSCNPKNLRLWEKRWLRFDSSVVPYDKPKTYF